MSERVPSLTIYSTSRVSCCSNSTPHTGTLQTHDYRISILLMGDHGVGKSSLINRFAFDKFGENMHHFFTGLTIKTVQLNGKRIKFHLWDTAGQERFRTIAPCHYRGVHGIVFVYDVTNEETFSNVNHWMEEAERYADERVNKMLVGNKCDLSKKKVVDYTTAKEYADERGITFIETSAKDATNVELAFLTMAAETKRLIDSL